MLRVQSRLDKTELIVQRLACQGGGGKVACLKKVHAGAVWTMISRSLKAMEKLGGERAKVDGLWKELTQLEGTQFDLESSVFGFDDDIPTTKKTKDHQAAAEYYLYMICRHFLLGAQVFSSIIDRYDYPGVFILLFRVESYSLPSSFSPQSCCCTQFAFRFQACAEQACSECKDQLHPRENISPAITCPFHYYLFKLYLLRLLHDIVAGKSCFIPSIGAVNCQSIDSMHSVLQRYVGFGE